MATVVIFGGGAGDQSVESPKVKALVAGESLVRSVRRASNLTGRSRRESKCEPGSLENECLLEMDGRRHLGKPSLWIGRTKANVVGEETGCKAADEIPGDVRGRHVEQERAAKARNHSWVA